MVMHHSCPAPLGQWDVNKVQHQLTGLCSGPGPHEHLFHCVQPLQSPPSRRAFGLQLRGDFLFRRHLIAGELHVRPLQHEENLPIRRCCRVYVRSLGTIDESGGWGRDHVEETVVFYFGLRKFHLFPFEIWNLLKH